MYQDSNRTIDEVYDVDNNQLITAYEFFKKPEHEIMHWRRALEESILTGHARLICPYCKQMLKLCGKKCSRGIVSYFSHLYDSDDCEIKTTTMQSREIIEAKKYGLAGESERHIRLKNMIAKALTTERSKDMGLSGVCIEQRINSDIPYMRWRRPDVQARYGNLNLVFELQLSTTFLSVVVDRDIFYRINGWYIIWVFNFEDNKEYVNLSNLMCKDIYYANKRNVFIFDNEAQRLSEEKDTLVLRCQWLDSEGRFAESEYITLDQLQFDSEEYKPYYIDADAAYYSIHPEVKERLQLLERSRTSILKDLMSRYNLEMKMRQEECERMEGLRQVILDSLERVNIFESNGKYGFEYKGTKFGNPTYDSISWDNTKQRFLLSKGRRMGYADRSGQIIVPCNYTFIKEISSERYLVLRNNNWMLLGNSTVLKRYSTTDCINTGIYDNGFLWIRFKFKKNSSYYSVSFVVFPNMNIISAQECADDKIIIGRLSFKVNKSGFLIHSINADIEIRISDTGLWGLFNSGKEILPFCYQRINYRSADEILVSKNEHIGIVNLAGETIIPLNYDHITHLTEDILKVGQSHKYGLFNTSGTEILPIIYDSIDIISNNLFLIEIDERKQLKGVASKDGKILIEPKYSELRIIALDNFIVREECDSPYSLINLQGQEIIPSSRGFMQIQDLQNGVYACCKVDKNQIGNKNADWQLYLNGNWHSGIIRAKEIKHCSEKFIVVAAMHVQKYLRYGQIENIAKLFCVDYRNIPLSPSFEYLIKSNDKLIAENGYSSEKFIINADGKFTKDGKIIKPYLKQQFLLANGASIISFEGKVGVGIFYEEEIYESLISFEYDNIVYEGGYYICRLSGRIEVYSSLGLKLLAYTENAKEVSIKPDGLIRIDYGRNEIEWRHSDFSIFIDKSAGITDIGFFQNGIADAKKGLENGKIDETGKPVAEIITTLCDGRDVIRIFGKCGIRDSGSKIVVPASYKRIEVLPNGFIIADNTIFNGEGQKIAVCVGSLYYLGADLLYSDNGWPTKLYIVNFKGERLSVAYDKIIFKDNYVYTEIHRQKDEWDSGKRKRITMVENFYGLCNSKGAEIVKAEYKKIIRWSDELLLFLTDYRKGVVVNMSSGDVSEIFSITKLQLSPDCDCYALKTKSQQYLIDASCSLIGEYAHIDIDKENNIICGTFRNGLRENVLTHEPIELPQMYEKYSIGSIHEGTVTGCKKYGVFVKIGNLVGMVHSSRIADKPLKPYNYPKGLIVQVMIIKIKSDGKLDLDFVTN